MIHLESAYCTVHVNHLHKFHSSVVDGNVNNCAITSEANKGFGEVFTIDVG